jgi:hypothetical protein
LDLKVGREILRNIFFLIFSFVHSCSDMVRLCYIPLWEGIRAVCIFVSIVSWIHYPQDLMGWNIINHPSIF